MDRIAQDFARMQRVRASFPDELRRPPTDAETAVALVRAQTASYTGSLETKVATLTTERDTAVADVERLNRNLRVLKATADQYGMHYPKWEVFAGLIEQALRGDRL